MASYEYYVNQGTSNLNEGYNYNLQQLINSLGGLVNPAVDTYTPGVEREVTDPRLRTIQEYLSELGAQDYQYKYDDILKALSAATDAGYAAQYNALDDAQRNYYDVIAANQQSAADTIRSNYAQAIQSGISRGMQSANLLSSILGTSQSAAQGAQELAQNRYQTGQDYNAQILKDAADALSKSNAAYETLMGNIRQLFNDEIQEKTADLEYNASILETNANHAASKYNADTNYASGILNNASGIYNNNQSVLGNMSSAGMSAAAQDNYSSAYQAAAQAAANATKYAADQSKAAQDAYTAAYAAAAAGQNNNGNNDNNGNAPKTDSSTKKTTPTMVPYHVGSVQYPDYHSKGTVTYWAK